MTVAPPTVDQAFRYFVSVGCVFRGHLLRHGADPRRNAQATSVSRRSTILTERDRTVGHRLAGQYLSRSRESDPLRVAEHFERGAVEAFAANGDRRISSGDAAAAVEKARPAVELLAELGALEEGESLPRLAYAEALHESGDTEGARVAIREARDHLHGRAAKIGSPEWRHRFITDVPDNARTLALARTWGA